MGRVVTNPTGSIVDASEVKILYESNENTNAYTDGDKASLGEVKDAIDMAKKVIEITFLLNDWTSNSDGTYSQTVNNSEIKSSMNPDLISMLSSGATPEEQKTYMKNFSILCQGVGNTANGSVTYKIYKQMTGNITVGLTRLGGVKQIESGGSVDGKDAATKKYVDDSIAAIPKVDTKNLVPYNGATKDVNLGSNSMSIKLAEEGAGLLANVKIGKIVGQDINGQANTSGMLVDARETYNLDGREVTDFMMFFARPGSINMSITSNSEGRSYDYIATLDASGLKVANGGNPTKRTTITPQYIAGLKWPDANDQAANKEYVDFRTTPLEPAIVELEGGSVPAGQWKTFSTSINGIPEKSGYTFEIIGILICETEAPDGMQYNCSTDITQKKIRMTYFNYHTGIDMPTSAKSAIVQYRYKLNSLT